LDKTLLYRWQPYFIVGNKSGIFVGLTLIRVTWWWGWYIGTPSRT